MTILVLGAGGFIGSHLVNKLRNEGHYLIGVDLKHPEYGASPAHEYHIGDLRDLDFCQKIFGEYEYDEVYQLAAEMGGAGYLFTGENDFDVMSNSAQINLNVAQCMIGTGAKKVFYSSSACIYPKRNQQDPQRPICSEQSAYPADPDSEYGWEKLFSERLYLNASKNYGLETRIARLHNVYGPMGTFSGGREKAPAALCRKVAMAKEGDAIEIWGDGTQSRSFLYIEDCLNGMVRLMRSEFKEPVNIGSEELITINDLAEMIIQKSGKSLSLKHVAGPVGVMGRTSDNTLAKRHLGWSPETNLEKGIHTTYRWIQQVIGNAVNIRIPLHQDQLTTHFMSISLLNESLYKKSHPLIQVTTMVIIP